MIGIPRVKWYKFGFILKFIYSHLIILYLWKVYCRDFIFLRVLYTKRTVRDYHHLMRKANPMWNVIRTSDFRWPLDEIKSLQICLYRVRLWIFSIRKFIKAFAWYMPGKFKYLPTLFINNKFVCCNQTPSKYEVWTCSEFKLAKKKKKNRVDKGNFFL